MNESIIPSCPKNYIALSIITAVTGFFTSCIGCPVGLIALYYAMQVETEYNAGNYDKALNASKNARLFSFAALGINILAFAFIVVYYVVLGGSAFLYTL